MSAKLKILVILILSIFATAIAGVYLNNRQQNALITNSTKPQQHSAAVAAAQEIVTNPERAKYKTIPLDSIKSVLQGTDPAALALDAFDNSEAEQGRRKVEVYYPQPNQALVTIVQSDDSGDTEISTVKYRVELTSFGRSLLASSPPLWQIVWAGSQEKCFSNQSKQNLVKVICQR
ncbi:MAG: hypothetical protein NHB32_08925 [Fischerella sp. CENA71]|nr:hypothetical protein [Fischerella sp. CENA71]